MGVGEVARILNGLVGIWRGRQVLGFISRCQGALADFWHHWLALASGRCPGEQQFQKKCEF